MGKNCSSPFFQESPPPFSRIPHSLFSQIPYISVSRSCPPCYLTAISTHFQQFPLFFQPLCPHCFSLFTFSHFLKPPFPSSAILFFACLCDLFDFFTNPQPLLLLLLLYFSFFYSFPAIFTFMQIHLLKFSSIARFTSPGYAYLLKKDKTHFPQGNQKKYSDSNYFTVFTGHTPLYPFYKTSKASQNETFLKL